MKLIKTPEELPENPDKNTKIRDNKKTRSNDEGDKTWSSVCQFSADKTINSTCRVQFDVHCVTNLFAMLALQLPILISCRILCPPLCLPHMIAQLVVEFLCVLAHVSMWRSNTVFISIVFVHSWNCCGQNARNWVFRLAIIAYDIPNWMFASVFVLISVLCFTFNCALTWCSCLCFWWCAVQSIYFIHVCECLPSLHHILDMIYILYLIDK